MLLTIDIGNTLIDFGLFLDETIVSTFKTESVANKPYEEYRSLVRFFLKSEAIDPASIKGVIISSVVPTLTVVFTKIATELSNVRAKVLGPGLHSGVRLAVDNPKEVGSDLVADTKGAFRKYGGNLFVADLGTASKYIYIDEKGAFGGVSIAPGLKISIDALVHGTAALPAIGLIAPSSPIGKNTADCMNSGLLYGTQYEVEGFASSFEKQLGKPLKRILTGGNAVYVKNLLPDFIYDERLLLEGLAAIYRENDHD